MSYQVSYETRDQYLLVRVSGPYDPVGARETMKIVREKATREGFTRILLDALEVGAPATELDRYAMGEAFAAMFPPPFRIAVLYRATRDTFAQNTAVIRGADLFICSEESEALPWLLADGPGQ
jgi:hypothetical protein